VKEEEEGVMILRWGDCVKRGKRTGASEDIASEEGVVGNFSLRNSALAIEFGFLVAILEGVKRYERFSVLGAGEFIGRRNTVAKVGFAQLLTIGVMSERRRSRGNAGS